MGTICIEMTLGEAESFDVRFWRFVHGNIDQLHDAYLKLERCIRDDQADLVLTFEPEALRHQLVALVETA